MSFYGRPNDNLLPRTPIACTNCRHRKRKCIIADDNPANSPPQCTRCRSQNLVCEFPAPDADVDFQEMQTAFYPSASAPAYGGSGYPSAPATPSNPGYTSMPGSSHASVQPGSGFYAHHPAARPALPYTGPPPPHTRPRYGGPTTYPSLALPSASASAGRGTNMSSDQGYAQAGSGSASAYSYGRGGPPTGGTGYPTAPPARAGSGMNRGYPPHAGDASASQGFRDREDNCPTQ
ncbi:Zn(2)-C6 fungal-type domain-containing protein [Mycena chlorophos]|uniref:Zn(2)-C6 fungal-type domain-containing protein n=1 Tax=Mycena chlorophos TaxID=658473 RepID=A0A8H6RZ38_MYCCL|nr:Zn(2)-C6 fungal-type domain-containing protein [Mycena chlorophos]